MAFDLSFLWCLGISLLIIGVLGIYFKNKLTEQEHKITAMFGIVTTMAEQISSLRKQTSQQSCPVEFTEQQQQQQQETKTVNLIPVSDDEEEEEEEEEDEEKEGNEEVTDDEKDDDDTCSTSSSESSEINDIDMNDIKTINMNIESNDFPLEELLELKVIKEEEEKENKNEEETDYKKMSLGKLRLIVQEKKIVQDASKTSKKDLLKMLSDINLV